MILKPDLYSSLRQSLAGALPGQAAHMRMASENRQLRLQHRKAPEDARRAGVLILLFEREQELAIPLIRRTEDGSVHSGQVALPGGTFEPADEDIVQTALRETAEEIGVKAATVEVLGRLSDLYIPPSNFLVSPVVGRIADPPDFEPDPHEVAHIIEASVSELLDEKRIKITERFGFTVPYFDIQDEVIWGATAMILSELCAILEPIAKG